MPSDLRDYYHTTSRSHATHDRNLPSIRDVVGEELELIDHHRRPNPYAFSEVRGALPASAFGHPSRGPTLPPIQQGGYSSSRVGPQGRYPNEYAPEAESHRGHQADYGSHSAQEQDYAYGVLRTSGTGRSLVHATPPAPRAHGILRQGGALPPTYDEDSEKRHKCEYCGKKFDRPSSLQVHVRTHTGSQPFTCEWPGCERLFSVRSNMLRHLRSHERSEVSQYPPQGYGHGGAGHGEYEDDYEETYAGGKSNSSSTKQSSSASNYYSSSRRK